MRPTFGFALQYVQDIEAARAFYEGVMGLRVERSHPVFVQFEHFAIASDESLSGTPMELYWLVDDVEAAHREIGGRASVSEIRSMPFGRLFTVEEPGGRPRFLIEMAKERPSEAV